MSRRHIPSKSLSIALGVTLGLGASLMAVGASMPSPAAERAPQRAKHVRPLPESVKRSLAETEIALTGVAKGKLKGPQARPHLRLGARHAKKHVEPKGSQLALAPPKMTKADAAKGFKSAPAPSVGLARALTNLFEG